MLTLQMFSYSFGHVLLLFSYSFSLHTFCCCTNCKENVLHMSDRSIACMRHFFACVGNVEATFQNLFKKKIPNDPELSDKTFYIFFQKINLSENLPNDPKNIRQIITQQTRSRCKKSHYDSPKIIIKISHTAHSQLPTNRVHLIQ